jgi:hypothetical protein
MSVIDITEEIVSEVDLNVEFTTQGMSVSVFVDECEVHDFVDYQTIAYHMVGDRDKYPEESIAYIRRQLIEMAEILGDALDE